MTEKDLSYFVNTVIQYFAQIDGEEPVMGLPYIKKNEAVVLDYTGMIGISGPRRGGIYFTAGASFLQGLTKAILGEEAGDPETLLDMVGELSNTVSGNVRRYFGPDFLISVPMLIRGKPEDILLRLKPPVFVIPLTWKGQKAFLVVGLE